MDFANLQKNYPTTAPKDLATLGYEGLTSMYFSSNQQLAQSNAKSLADWSHSCF